ncbi:uncharacterized protein LOC141697684 isoform X3 [Apium graveolens]|uniref:uncharacterized protein LOC141697684 isoform X3 n=1 Tax=Apium graveolens TaxID=4045 RepID=UPI003D7BDA0C
MMSKTEDDEERRRKYEEALEVKSLRRIISAYLNYPEAAEEDLKRYERSFRRLPPAHKGLLSHLPLKYQRLRRCISKNSYFIFEMLKAFEPPLDLSQDLDICEQDPQNIFDNTREINYCSCGSASTCKKGCHPGCNEAISGEERNVVFRSPEQEEKLGLFIESDTGSRHVLECDTKADKASNAVKSQETSYSNADSNNNEEKLGIFIESGTGSRHVSECDTKADKAGTNGVKIQETLHSNEDSDYNVSSSPDWLDPSLQSHVPLVDVDKVRCIIRNIVRDWAAEGQQERDQCYKPILEELKSQFPDRSKGSPPACLVPGAGLGRLALEISCLGFASQGNEFSYYMMICSSFILNQAERANEWTIHPWIHSNCNSLSDSDQLRPISIPDIHPASAGITEGFSMCGGDFVEVYCDPSQVGAWDAVVTCFFLDTAHNIVEYIEVISRILKDGGVWINLGPLLYHFADMYSQEDEMSVELSLEDVKKVALHYGFELENEKTIETTYTTNPRSMMQNHYFTAFWTMRKGAAGVKLLP